MARRYVTRCSLGPLRPRGMAAGPADRSEARPSWRCAGSAEAASGAARFLPERDGGLLSPGMRRRHDACALHPCNRRLKSHARPTCGLEGPFGRFLASRGRVRAPPGHQEPGSAAAVDRALGAACRLAFAAWEAAWDGFRTRERYFRRTSPGLRRLHRAMTRVLWPINPNRAGAAPRRPRQRCGSRRRAWRRCLPGASSPCGGSIPRSRRCRGSTCRGRARATPPPRGR
ncbi:UNVERIFIED_ORG: hypothetical protein M2438_003109 [Methylobacterium sp. SuP10 SLI 274]|nr:hypothetical protein [Methylorubrum extorquens]MDF9864346.1 hypothetical protein [Methylorubrum pseudosasae]MDH6637934.1 hypothetical protein [Methylobacterium sp. SuP10 SLI 274]MDH6667117.1 hypothetical protein [Methylorubrum zatmanii]